MEETPKSEEQLLIEEGEALISEIDSIFEEENKLEEQASVSDSVKEVEEIIKKLESNELVWKSKLQRKIEILKRLEEIRKEK
jgi:hypothetical protein